MSWRSDDYLIFSDLAGWIGKHFGNIVGKKTKLNTVIGSIILFILTFFVADLLFNGLTATESLLSFLF